MWSRTCRRRGIPVSGSSLPHHLALALNLRGIGVYDPAKPPERDFFTWLARKHQYRHVGFTPALMDHPDVDIEGYKTFEPAADPIEGLERIAQRSDVAQPWVLESLLAASAFIAPLFIHRPALPAFEPFAAFKQESAADLPEDQVMRHLRIAGYGMLDGYEALTASGYAAVTERELEAECRDRAAFAEDDAEERFWRLNEEVDGDAWVGGYFDVLPALRDDTIPEIFESNPDLQVGLGLVGGFAVDPPYE